MTMPSWTSSRRRRTSKCRLKLDEEELLSLSDDTESWSDDPVRMYLTQMGEIPLLTRQQEIYLAKKIELTRRRFRPSCWNATMSFSRPTRC